MRTLTYSRARDQRDRVYQIELVKYLGFHTWSYRIHGLGRLSTGTDGYVHENELRWYQRLLLRYTRFYHPSDEKAPVSPFVYHACVDPTGA